MTHDMPLTSLYLQIENANSHSVTLGVNNQPTELDLRESYHAIALRIHPDRAPSDSLRELHTSLFQKVQAAYDELLKIYFDKSADNHFAGPTRLPETSASLHARNVAFQGALRDERQKALKSKKDVHLQGTAKQANLKAKNERLTQQREAREKTLQEAREKKAAKIASKAENIAKRIQQTKVKLTSKGTAPRLANDQPPLDWEQEFERLEAEEQRLEAKGERNGAHTGQQTTTTATSTKASPAALKHPPQNQPTARTARPMWDDSIDERLVSDADIQGRWNKQLLSGGGVGSVSLSQKKQRQHSGAARVHMYTKALCEEADGLLKPALTGNRTFSALVENEMMESAFLGAEAKIDKRTDTVLRLMDADVNEKHLLEGEGPMRVMALE